MDTYSHQFPLERGVDSDERVRNAFHLIRGQICTLFFVYRLTSDTLFSKCMYTQKEAIESFAVFPDQITTSFLVTSFPHFQ